MVAQFGRRRKDFPERLDLLVGIEERLSWFGLQKASVDDALEPLVRGPAFTGIQRVATGTIELEQQVKRYVNRRFRPLLY